MKRDYKIYAVDFDGTLHFGKKFPFIKEPNKHLIAFLMTRRASGDKVILWTCREGRQLKYALDWCEEQGIVFDAVNDNIPEMIKEFRGSNSRKVFADYYIDDSNIANFKYEILIDNTRLTDDDIKYLVDTIKGEVFVEVQVNVNTDSSEKDSDAWRTRYNQEPIGKNRLFSD